MENQNIYKFYFYHLKGIKIGCTINPAKRFLANQRKYGKKFKHTIILVKETTIDEATVIEANFAKQFGYINHSEYKLTFKNSILIKETEEFRQNVSNSNWLKNGKCTDEYRNKMSKSIIRLNRKRGALGREKLGSGVKENNPYFGKNYYKEKTEEELKEISRKRSETNKLNKQNHMYKGGNEVVIYGIKYKSINEASRVLGYSFKYLKRRVTEIDYKDCYFV